MNAKKIIALVLALVLCVGMLAGCGDNNANTNSPDPNNTNTGTPDNTGSNEPETFTYNYAMSVFPTLWNYFTYETSTDAEILDYITDGFYTFDYNEAEDGYAMVPSMAAGDPIDVTADYIGQYGLEEGATSRAYIIELRDDLKWENGDVINATTFVESLKRLLAPEAQNYRADSVYAGSFVIHGAQDYLYQGQEVTLENAINAAYQIADLVVGDDGNYYTAEGGAVYVAVAAPLSDWLSGNSLADYVGAYGDSYFGMDHWEELSAAADENGYAPLNADTMAWLTDVITANPAWGEDETCVPYYLAYDMVYPEFSWDGVGAVALSDTELLIVMDKALEGFYLKYNMFVPLVNIDLYDSLTSVTDGVFSNSYGTSVDTTMSYGPYKLTAFQADKQYTLEKNTEWHGLTEGTYETTHIVVDYVPEASTRLELFLQGKLDSYGLTIDDMDEYSLSDYCYYTPGDSTYAMVFNPDMDALVAGQESAGANINKTILTLPEFRQAMSLALNRADFCLATSPTNGPAFALYSEMIVSDPENGVTYRATDVAKNVLAQFWGVSEDYGEGKLYEDIDEAIDSITGYNLTKAQQLFDAAYDAAIAQGLMDADDVVEIKIGTPNNTSAFYNNGYEFIVNNYTEAVKGTKLEGKLVFSRDDTLGNGFAEALQNNQVDMLFGVGWTGSALDPYGLMEAYVSASYQYDDSVDYTTFDATVSINGVDYTTDVWSWYQIMNGSPVTITSTDGSSTLENYVCGSTDGDPETRLQILGALEGAVLLNFNFIPIMNASSASLKGQQYNYYTEEYIFGMGRGGVKYYTYNYNDAEWNDYVASCGGTLSYN